jgi:CRP-like cAMP-binding protein
MAKGIPAKVVQKFRQIPLFAGVSGKGIRALIQAAEVLDIPAGTVLVKEGQIDRRLFVLTRGTAVVTRNGRKLRELVPGDYFGEMAFLIPQPRSATVKAFSDVRVLMIGPRELEDVIREDGIIALRMLDTMARRVVQNQRTGPY